MHTPAEIIATLTSVAGVPGCEVEYREGYHNIAIYIDDLDNLRCYRKVFYIGDDGRPDDDYTEYTTGARMPGDKSIDWSGDWAFISDDLIPSWVREAYARMFTAYLMLI
jgi:hypothetical protein